MPSPLTLLAQGGSFMLDMASNSFYYITTSSATIIDDVFGDEPHNPMNGTQTIPYGLPSIPSPISAVQTATVAITMPLQTPNVCDSFLSAEFTTLLPARAISFLNSWCRFRESTLVPIAYEMLWLAIILALVLLALYVFFFGLRFAFCLALSFSSVPLRFLPASIYGSEPDEEDEQNWHHQQNGQAQPKQPHHGQRKPKPQLEDGQQPQHDDENSLPELLSSKFQAMIRQELDKLSDTITTAVTTAIMLQVTVLLEKQLEGTYSILPNVFETLKNLSLVSQVHGDALRKLLERTPTHESIKDLIALIEGHEPTSVSNFVEELIKHHTYITLCSDADLAKRRMNIEYDLLGEILTASKATSGEKLRSRPQARKSGGIMAPKPALRSRDTHNSATDSSYDDSSSEDFGPGHSIKKVPYRPSTRKPIPSSQKVKPSAFKIPKCKAPRAIISDSSDAEPKWPETKGAIRDAANTTSGGVSDSPNPKEKTQQKNAKLEDADARGTRRLPTRDSGKQEPTKEHTTTSAECTSPAAFDESYKSKKPTEDIEPLNVDVRVNDANVSSFSSIGADKRESRRETSIAPASNDLDCLTGNIENPGHREMSNEAKFANTEEVSNADKPNRAEDVRHVDGSIHVDKSEEVEDSDDEEIIEVSEADRDEYHNITREIKRIRNLNKMTAVAIPSCDNPPHNEAINGIRNASFAEVDKRLMNHSILSVKGFPAFMLNREKALEAAKQMGLKIAEASSHKSFGCDAPSSECDTDDTDENSGNDKLNEGARNFLEADQTASKPPALSPSAQSTPDIPGPESSVDTSEPNPASPNSAQIINTDSAAEKEVKFSNEESLAQVEVPVHMPEDASVRVCDECREYYLSITQKIINVRISNEARTAIRRCDNPAHNDVLNSQHREACVQADDVLLDTEGHMLGVQEYLNVLDARVEALEIAEELATDIDLSIPHYVFGCRKLGYRCEADEEDEESEEDESEDETPAIPQTDASPPPSSQVSSEMYTEGKKQQDCASCPKPASTIIFGSDSSTLTPLSWNDRKLMEDQKNALHDKSINALIHRQSPFAGIKPIQGPNHPALDTGNGIKTENENWPQWDGGDSMEGQNCVRIRENTSDMPFSGRFSTFPKAAGEGVFQFSMPSPKGTWTQPRSPLGDRPSLVEAPFQTSNNPFHPFNGAPELMDYSQAAARAFGAPQSPPSLPAAATAGFASPGRNASPAPVHPIPADTALVPVEPEVTDATPFPTAAKPPTNLDGNEKPESPNGTAKAALASTRMAEAEAMLQANHMNANAIPACANESHQQRIDYVQIEAGSASINAHPLEKYIGGKKQLAAATNARTAAEKLKVQITKAERRCPQCPPPKTLAAPSGGSGGVGGEDVGMSGMDNPNSTPNNSVNARRSARADRKKRRRKDRELF